MQTNSSKEDNDKTQEFQEAKIFAITACGNCCYQDDSWLNNVYNNRSSQDGLQVIVYDTDAQFRKMRKYCLGQK